MRLKLFVQTMGIAVSLMLTSCSTFVEETANESTIKETNGDLIIGEKIEVPHTLKNMQKAYDQLVNEGKRTRAILEPTHLYICFKAKNEEEYNKLVFDYDFVLFDYPLDYEIIGEGTGVSNPLGGIFWQYSVVDINAELPNIEYEILDEAYIIEAEEGTRASNEYEELEEIAYSAINAEDVNDVRGRRWRPQANIKVKDTLKNIDRPVHDVQVICQSGLRYYRGWTNINGYFRCDKRYLGKARYEVKFEYHDTHWDIRDGKHGQADVSTYIKGDWNPVFHNNSTAFHALVYIFAKDHYDKCDHKLRRKSIRAYDKEGEDAWDKFHGFGENWTELYRYKTSGHKRSSEELLISTVGALSKLQYFDDLEIYHYEFEGLFSNAMRLEINKKYGFTHQRFNKSYLTSNIRLSFFIDLMDNDNQPQVQDRVSGYTFFQILEQSRIKVKSAWFNPVWSLSRDQVLDKFIGNLKNAYNNPTEQYLDELRNQL